MPVKTLPYKHYSKKTVDKQEAENGIFPQTATLARTALLRSQGIKSNVLPKASHGANQGDTKREPSESDVEIGAIEHFRGKSYCACLQSGGRREAIKTL